MSSLAPTLQAFFTYRLAQQRQASAHTVAAYRDTFRQLFAFLHQRSGKAPSQLAIEDLDAPVIGAFLENLEHGRGNSVRTRNARLAAVRSFSTSRPSGILSRQRSFNACWRFPRSVSLVR